MLIDVIRDIEKKAGPAPAERNPVSPTDKDVVQQLIARCAAASAMVVPAATQWADPDNDDSRERWHPTASANVIEFRDGTHGV
ncbi:MAG: hypothetical protein JO139_00960 [Alphaproteobacteria bacterium]|nr:hypothetical protein [Alphaproteobacteria bacterium]